MLAQTHYVPQMPQTTFPSSELSYTTNRDSLLTLRVQTFKVWKLELSKFEVKNFQTLNLFKFKLSNFQRCMFAAIRVVSRWSVCSQMHGQWVVSGILTQTRIVPQMPQMTFHWSELLYTTNRDSLLTLRVQTFKLWTYISSNFVVI